MIVARRGNGNGTDIEFSEPILFENWGTTNLGERNVTLGLNIGYGVNFGKRNEFEAAVFFNLPIQKIQTKTSNYQYLWKYENIEYFHQLEYYGKIYYPNLKLTYYIF